MDGWLERLRTVHISRRGFIRVAARYLAAGGAMAATGPFVIGCRPGAPTRPVEAQKELVIIYGRAPGDHGPAKPHQYIR